MEPEPESGTIGTVFFQEPKAEPEPPEPFIRKQNWNRNRTLLCKLRRHAEDHRDQQSSTNFFAQSFRAFWDILAKILAYPAQKFGFPGFRGTYRTFCERPPPYRKTSGPKSLGLCSFFSCLKETLTQRNRRKQNPEPLEPFRARTITEQNWGHPARRKHQLQVVKCISMSRQRHTHTHLTMQSLCCKVNGD